MSPFWQNNGTTFRLHGYSVGAVWSTSPANKSLDIFDWRLRHPFHDKPGADTIKGHFFGKIVYDGDPGNLDYARLAVEKAWADLPDEVREALARADYRHAFGALYRATRN